MERILVNGKFVSMKKPVSVVVEADKDPKPAVIVEDNDSELEAMTIKELKAFAADKGIELGKASKKGELVDLIEISLSESSEEL